MEGLYSLLASELAKNLPSLSTGGEFPQTRRLSGSRVSRNKLQLNRFPVIIDAACYRNPHSSDNSTGDYCAAYRFYELSDEASRLTTFFEGACSVSSVWASIINSAVLDNGISQKRHGSPCRPVHRQALNRAFFGECLRDSCERGERPDAVAGIIGDDAGLGYVAYRYVRRYKVWMLSLRPDLQGEHAAQLRQAARSIQDHRQVGKNYHKIANPVPCYGSIS